MSGTTHLSAQDIANKVYGTHGATLDGTLGLKKIGGRYDKLSALTAQGAAREVVAWFDDKGVLVPHEENLQLDSATTVTGSATGTTQTGLGRFKYAQVYVNVSAATGTSPTLDIYLDSRLDGTNYKNIAHLTQITGTIDYSVQLSKANLAGQVDVTSDAGAGTIRSVGWGDDLRVRRDIGGTSPQFTYKVWLQLTG